MIPDGFFFDFTELSDPQFYIVEVELSGHSFYNHIFPQITQFFALFRITRLQQSLIDKIFSITNTDDSLKNDFKKFLGQTEVYNFLSGATSSKQNILLIADGEIAELPEIMDTCTDTWDKLVRCLEIKKYQSGNATIYTITPDFETIQYEDFSSAVDEEGEEATPKYNESYHLENVGKNVKAIYENIKRFAAEIDEGLVFNSQNFLHNHQIRQKHRLFENP